MSGSFCRSLYSFNGDQHQQGLKFEAGEVIRVTQALDGGWWEGEKDGVKGWFPSTYVQLLPMWRLLSITSQQKKTDDVINRKWLDFALVFPETTWERPSSTPGTPKTPVKHKNSVPTGGEHLYIIQIGEKLQKKMPAHCEGEKANAKQQTFRSQHDLLPFKAINCVTFPFPLHMSEQQLLKPDEWSYCDYFWADRKDPQGSANISGFEVLLQKQLKGRQMQKEMAEFVRERIRIEEEYAKNLSKLSQIPLAAQEEGTLGEAWAQLKKSLADEAEVHLKFSSKLQSEVEKPLLIFRENFKKDMKKFDHHMADLRKQLTGRNAAVEKARKSLADRQKDLELKTQQLEIKLSSKIEEDIKKARRKSTQAGDDLMRCVDLYNQSQSKWFEEMVTSSLELERLEVERVEMIRQHLCQYTTLRHETDMFNQSTIEPVDKLLRSVDPAKDRELWVKEHKTGELRPVDMDI
uniref:Growth arrest specific 7 n=1 Tax=Sinocyclocheilus grahami TaxID=75366 RepID=A0A672JUU3_SINGR